MRIVQITPGTGNFICGLCVRDNTLVSSLRDLGHDAQMVPLYLPFVTDDEDTSEGSPILFGGINVYLQEKSGFFRMTPRWVDRWFDSRKLLSWSADKAGMTSAEDLGELTLSSLRGEEGHQIKEVNRLVDWLEEYGKPDVVCLATGLLVGLARAIKSRLGVPVICTLSGEDGYLDSLPSPFRAQSWDLLRQRSDDIDVFVPVSIYYKDVMRDRLQLPEERFRAVQNGISLKGFEKPAFTPEVPTLGYLARFCHPKGLHTLVEAFVLLKERNQIPGLILKAAGTAAPMDKPYIEGLETRLKDAGLGEDFQFLPNLSRQEKIEFLRSLTVFSVPAVDQEAFGLYLLEAMACGVPVVQPRRGAFPEILEATGGGILTESDDPEEMADAIEGLFLDEERRAAVGGRGLQVVFEKFSAERMGREVAAICEELLQRKIP